jgi:hypothetical protein
MLLYFNCWIFSIPDCLCIHPLKSWVSVDQVKRNTTGKNAQLCFYDSLPAERFVMKEVLDHSYPQSCPIEEDARSIARGSFMVTVTNITYLGQWQHKGMGNLLGCKQG